MKRVFDVVISLLLIILFSPLMIGVSLLIIFDTTGGAIYTQKRVGLNGKLFDIYKFRTMVLDKCGMGGFCTMDNDPRTTKFGKFIRCTSIDELPQLLNVLVGDMSLIGPRPDVPEQRNIYTEDEWRLRCSVLPGITGLQQATLRSNATIEERKKLDFEYIEKKGWKVDLYIIWKTILQVISKGGN